MKVEIVTFKEFPKRKFPEFKQESKCKWSAYMPKRDAIKSVKKANKLNMKAIAFDERYDRSPYYRYEFIRKNPPENGMYRCVYCGRLVKKDDMEVDHILPVRRAKESKRLQRKLKNGVNEITNLVPSCHRCNQKKGDSMALKWRIKAALGQHRVYWALRYMAVLMVVVVLMVILSGKDLSYFDAKISELYSMAQKYIEQLLWKFGDMLQMRYR